VKPTLGVSLDDLRDEAIEAGEVCSADDQYGKVK
jgi:hypothetical protein